MAAEPFELDQVRAFEAVARTGGFRPAADDLGTAQSSVSQQVKRLEEQLGHPLFRRTTRRVELTDAGQALLIYARALLGLAEQTRRHFDRPPPDGVLRLGIVEDFAIAQLHRVLALFRRGHPRFAFTLRTGLSAQLFGGLDAGELDVVLAKRLPGRSTGRLLWAEPLAWFGDVGAVPAAGTGDPVPIVTYPAPSETRDVLLNGLRSAGRTWSVVAESVSLAALGAAVVGGLGVAAFSRRLPPAGVVPLPPDVGLPPLGDVEYVIDQRATPRDASVDAFVEILSPVAHALAVSEPPVAGDD